MSSIHLERNGDVAILRLDQPGEKLNTLSLDLLDEFRSALDDLEPDSEVRSLVIISSKAGCFIAGADLRRFADLDTVEAGRDASRKGSRLLDRLTNYPKPVVAAINGAALGGGLEVALACCYRLATDHPKTVLGLPEVKLGLLPGLGGTQRLPRLIGLRTALDMLLTGKNIYPYKARKLGLVDAIVDPFALEGAAIGTARRLAGGWKPRSRTSRVDRVLALFPLRRIVLRKARQQVKRLTRGNYPAPERILACVGAGLGRGVKKGLRAESNAFGELLQTPQSKQLVSLFFAVTEAARNPEASLARPLREVGVLGAGLMGSGIAQVTAEKGYTVRLKDLSGPALGNGERAIWSSLQKKVRGRAISEFQRDRILSRIKGVTDFSAFQRVDLVVEAVFEDVEIKRSVLREFEEAAPADAIFATNTSALPVSRLTEVARRPQQVIGMHYFSPVPKMPLLEIVVTDRTDDWVTATCVDLGIRQGKTVIVVKDSPGFYTTRVLAALMHEALVLLAEGADIRKVDESMRDFGFPVGPFQLMDEVGLDVAAHVSATLAEVFTDRDASANAPVDRLLEAGFKGKKSGRGFYVHQDRKRGRKQVNPDLMAKAAPSRGTDLRREELQSLLALSMVNEAARCLDEGVLRSPRDGDLGAVLGLGFPPFLGGPFRYLDTCGADRVAEDLKRLESEYGARFQLAQSIEEQASKGGRFYPES